MIENNLQFICTIPVILLISFLTQTQLWNPQCLNGCSIIFKFSTQKTGQGRLIYSMIENFSTGQITQNSWQITMTHDVLPGIGTQTFSSICHFMSYDAYDIEIWHMSIWLILVSKRPSGPQQTQKFIQFWLKNV